MSLITLERSDGKLFTYGDVYRIFSYGLTGVGTTEAEIFSESKAIGDGDVVTGQRIPARVIDVQGLSLSRAANGIARIIANDFFSFRFEYKLHIEYKGRKAWIPALLKLYDLPTENIHAPQKLNVQFFCPNPFFRSESAFGKDIAQVTPMWGWPYMEHPTYGRVVSVYDFSQSVVITNEGDVPTHPVVEVRARGEVINPRIIKDDLFVEVQVTMATGDMLVIDFSANRVTLNGENIIQKVSKDSSLTSIVFERGDNLISYDAASGANVMSCHIYYYDLFNVGV